MKLRTSIASGCLLLTLASVACAQGSQPGYLRLFSSSPTNVEGNEDGFDRPALSENGQFIAFTSEANNLVLGDTNGRKDVFVKDRNTGVVERVSVTTAGSELSRASDQPDISDDGRYVLFRSLSPELNENSEQFMVWMHDRKTHTTTLASRISHGKPPGNCWDGVISGNGKVVAFITEDPKFLSLIGPSQHVNQVIVRNVGESSIELASVDKDGQPVDGDCDHGLAISSTGRFVAFCTQARNLHPRDQDNTDWDLYIRDRQTQRTNDLTINGQSTMHPAMSGDGQVVVCDALGRFLPGAPNSENNRNVYYFDRKRNRAGVVSVNPAGIAGNDWSFDPQISKDGHYVTFRSNAIDLVSETDNRGDQLFLRNLWTDTTTLVSKSASGEIGNRRTLSHAINGDGSYVVFLSAANNLADGGQATQFDQFFLRNYPGAPSDGNPPTE